LKKKRVRLGRVLVQAWSKKTKKSAGKAASTFRSKKPTLAKISRGSRSRKGHLSLKISLRSSRRYSLVSQAEIQSPAEPIVSSAQAIIPEAPLVSEPQTQSLVLVEESPSPLAQRVLEPSAEVQVFPGVYALSSADLIRPHDKLKQSIEGFLLDQRSEHTRKAYGRDLKRLMMFLSARNFQQGPSELNRTILIAYKESLLKEGLEHTTVDRHLATLKSFFKWLVEDGILIRSPADGVRFLNPKRLSTTIGFSDEEVKKILAVPDLHSRVGSLHYAILMVLFYCGLRRSEACSLRTIHLGTERNQRVLRLRGKGNAERVIVMIPPVWNAIKHLFLITRRDLSVDQPLFMPIRNNRTQDTKKSVDPSMIFYIVTKYAKLAGIANRVSPHSCRATAISNARDHQVPDRAIQEFAGWASPDMITRYDKRRTSVENSAAHAIYYGGDNRVLPQTGESPAGASTQDLIPDESTPQEKKPNSNESESLRGYDPIVTDLESE
jgi:hypothetical protein